MSAAFIPPSEALAFLNHTDSSTAKRAIIERCREGLVTATADLAIIYPRFDDGEVRRFSQEAIPVGLWAESDFYRPAFWETGDITVTIINGVRKLFGVRFARDEIAALRPAMGPAIVSKIKAEHECAAWLLETFKAEAGVQSKADYQAQALARYKDRLSTRGFLRAWDSVAPGAGRSSAGAKRQR